MSTDIDIYRGFDYRKIRSTFLRFIDKTLIINPRFFYKVYQGYGFAISKRFEGVASDGYVDVYFENPSGSGREVFIISIEVVSFAQGWIDIYRNNSIISNGTKLTPINLNFSSSNESVVNVEYGGNYSLGNLVHNTVIGGGSHIRAVGSVSEVGEAVVIPSGFNFLIRVTNKSASASDLSIRIIWWEE